MHRARWLILAALLSLALLISASHTAAQGGTPTTWRIYTHTDDVYALAVAPDGVTIWAATGGGVVRWDTASGARRVFTIDDGLPDNQTRDVLIDPATGYVWVGTYGGLARWNGTSWRVWTTADGLWTERVEGLGVDGAGHIWAAASAPASIWDGVTMRKYPDICDALTANFTAARQATQPNRLWAVEAGQWVWTTVGAGDGVRRHDGTTCQDFNTDTLPGLPSNVVVAVVTTPDGAVWFGTQQGIARRDASGQMTLIGQDTLPDSPVETMTVDGQGRVWAAFGCESGCVGGVARIDARGTANLADDQIQVFPMGAGGLPGRVPRAVAAARGGGAWVGTDAGPVPIRGDGSIGGALRAPGLPSNQVNALLMEGSDPLVRLWVGTDSGLALLERDRDSGAETWTVYDQASAGLPSNRVHAIVRLGLDLWVATGENGDSGPLGGVSRLTDSGAWLHYTSVGRDTFGNVQALAKDNQGRLWAGNTGGVGIAPRLFMLSTGGDWRTWIGGSGGFGAIRDLAAAPSTQTPGSASGCPSGRACLWLATDTGLYLMDHGDSPQPGTPFVRFTSQGTGQPALNSPTSVAVDGQGKVWVGSWLGAAVRSTTGTTWQAYTVGSPANGLPSNLIYHVAFNPPAWPDNGGVWLLTAGGAVRFTVFGTPTQALARPNSPAEAVGVTSLARRGSCEYWLGSAAGLSAVAQSPCSFPATPTPAASPTASGTVTRTMTPTITPTATPTATRTATGTATPSATPSPSATPTMTATATDGPSPTPTATATATNTPTATPTPSATPTRSPFELFLPHLAAKVKGAAPFG